MDCRYLDSKSQRIFLCFIFSQFKAVAANYKIMRYKPYVKQRKILICIRKIKPEYYFKSLFMLVQVGEGLNGTL